MGRHARRADEHAEAVRRRAAGEGGRLLRGTVGAENAGLVGDVKTVQLGAGGFHHRPVGIAAQYDRNFFHRRFPPPAPRRGCLWGNHGFPRLLWHGCPRSPVSVRRYFIGLYPVSQEKKPTDCGENMPCTLELPCEKGVFCVKSGPWRRARPFCRKQAYGRPTEWDGHTG